MHVLHLDTVPGLSLFCDILDPKEEAAILACVEASPWRADLRRRVQHYGYRYDYRARAVRADMHLGPMPQWLTEVCAFVSDHVQDFAPDQVIVNEYLPGQGIGTHIDCPPCFGPMIASLSLCADIPMVFRQGPCSVEVQVPRRSLLVLTGAARWSWSHEIPARTDDPLTGPRSRRVSLTFRTVDL